jgi:two-component system, cell cycle sensor histidine kinase and response regulator CckA
VERLPSHPLFEHLPVGILVYRMDGQCVFASPVAAVLLGIPCERLLHGNIRRPVSTEGSDLIPFAKLAMDTGGSREGEVLIPSGSEALRRVHAHVSLVELEAEPVLLALLKDKGDFGQTELSQRFMQYSVDHAGEFVFWTNRDGGFVYANEAFCDRLGYSQDELSSMHVSDVTVGMTEDGWKHRWEEARALGTLSREVERRTRSGEIFPSEVSVNYFRYGGVEYNVTFSRDVTERRRTEEALRASEARLRSYVDSAGDAIFVIDAETGRIRDCNTRACRELGYSRSELKKLNTRDIEAKLTAEEIDAINRALTSDGVTTIEGAHRRKDGSVFPVEIRSSSMAPVQPGHILAIVRDATESKRAEEALKQSEERHRLLADNASDVIWTMDAEGHFTYVSPSVEKLRGFSAAEVMQQSMREALTPTSAALAEVAIKKAMSVIQAGQPCPEFRGELEQPCKDGSTVWTDATVSGMRDAAGEFSGFLGVTRDITERKQSIEALKEREEQLRQAQKMEAVGQLAGGIAHDFNNLLTAIIGYSDLILGSSNDDAEALRADVMEIKTAADRASVLTRQILAFSRRQALRPEVVSLNDIVAGTERLLRHTLGEDIDLTALLRSDLGLVEADASQFEQVLMNLAVNSRDAMKHGGTLTLETANVELGEEYCGAHPGAKPGLYVMLAVSDTGTGMDTETSSRAFEPFFTTKEPGKGTGLGLSTVYGIVKQSGGNILLYSEPGLGTTFKIYLPRVDKPRVVAKSAAVAERAPVSGKEAVLAVEDEEAVRALVTRVLSRLGYKVTTACSGDEAYALLTDGDKLFDLLLTDVVLPGRRQGNDLAKEAKLLRPDMPVLFMSGYTRDAIVHAGRLDPGVNYLEKPFTPGSLGAKVREVLDFSGVPAGGSA